MKKRDPKAISRRNLLQGGFATGMSSLFFNPVTYVLEAVVNGIVNEAHAQSTGSLMNLVSMKIGGGLNRIHFDNIIKPFDDSTIIDSLGVRTKFNVSGSTIASEYDTTKIGRTDDTMINFPWLWNSMLPGRDGLPVEMNKLANNMLTVRGFESFIGDGHEVNHSLTVRPVGGKSSLHGLNAEQANFLFPAVMKGGFYFTSTKGKVSHGFGNSPQALNGLFAAYYKPDLIAVTSQEVGDALDDLVKKIKSRYVGINSDMEVLYKNREKIISLSKQALGDLDAIFGPMADKYKDLNKKVANSHNLGMALAGLDDKPLPVSKSDPLWKIQFSGKFDSAIDTFTSDMRERLTGYMVDDELRDVASNDSLAYGFAMAEYLLLNGYSNTFHIGTGLIDNFYYNVKPANGGGFNYYNSNGLGIDQHETGAHGALWANSKGYQMMSACMLEFIDVLKDNDKFNDTVLWLTSEFGRSPRADGTGSDHGYNCQSESFWSGSIEGPQLAGNIQIGSETGTYAGTYGVAAGLDAAYGFETPTNKHINTSLCTMLKLEPFLNNPPLVKWESGKIVTITGKPKNV